MYPTLGPWLCVPGDLACDGEPWMEYRTILHTVHAQEPLMSEALQISSTSCFWSSRLGFVVGQEQALRRHGATRGASHSPASLEALARLWAALHGSKEEKLKWGAPADCCGRLTRSAAIAQPTSSHRSPSVNVFPLELECRRDWESSVWGRTLQWQPSPEDRGRAEKVRKTAPT